MEENLPARLEEIVEDFQIIRGREKLEYLLEFSENLPALPDWLQEKRDELEQVHECMTPVFVFVQNRDGELHYHFDIPPESPTVRGYAEILRQGTEGLSPEEILAIPHDFYLEMGMSDVLSAQRLNGLGAILNYVKQLAARQLAAQGAPNQNGASG
jgi:cysteine desulfuration protein SufE